MSMISSIVSRSPIPVLALIMLIGCGRREPGPKPGVGDAVPEGLPVPRAVAPANAPAAKDLVAAVAAGEAAVELTQETKPVYIAQGAVITDYAAQDTFMLIVRNLSAKPLRLALPQYLRATDLTQEVEGIPGEREARYKHGPFIVVAPARETAVEGGQSAELRVTTLWSVGGLPKGSGGWGTRRFSVSVLPADSVEAKAADHCLALDEPLRKSIGQKLFWMISGKLLETDVQKLVQGANFAELGGIEKALRACGVPLEKFPALAEADKARRRLLDLFEAGLKDPKAARNALDLLNDPPYAKLVKDDADVARSAARYLGPPVVEIEDKYLMVSPAEYVISRLEYCASSDPVVLNSLLTCAMTHETERVRMAAAITSAKLDDVRALPILMQYVSNVNVNDDVKNTKTKCVWALKEWEQKGETWVDKMKIEDLDSDEFVRNSAFKTVPAEDLKALRAFLAGGKNLHTEAFEQTCVDAKTGKTAHARIEAVHALSQAEIHRKLPKVIEILIDRLHNDADYNVRREAAEALRWKRDPRVKPALEERLEKETERSVQSEIKQTLEYRQGQKLDER